MAHRADSVAPEGVERRGRMLDLALRALVLLRRDRWQVDALAEALGEHRRTVYRLLHSLEQAGIEVVSEREGRESFYRVTRASVMRALDL